MSRIFDRIRDSRPVYPTAELEELPALWAAAEERYPPKDGWGLKIFRRWIGGDHDGAVWSVSFTRDRILGEIYVGADGISPSDAFRVLLDPHREDARRQASVRYSEQLLAEAEQAVTERKEQLARLKT